jgi:hypothetical protein
MPFGLTPSALQSEPISRAETGAEVKRLDPLTDGSQWDKLVLAHPDATIFHSAAWARVLNKTYGHKPVYLHVSTATGGTSLIPLMEICSAITGRRGVCLPFSDFCAPLISGAAASPGLYDQLSSIGQERRWRYFEIRGGNEALPPPGPAAAIFYGHSLSLVAKEEDLWLRCSSAVRRGIRKARKSGLRIEIADTRTAIVEFFELHTRTRRRHGLPPQPLAFFLSIYEEMVRAGHGFIVLARKQAHLVSAAVFFKFGRNALYKYGASDNSFQEFRGNNLTMWEGISFLGQLGCHRLHFGRTSVDNEGLRRFKLSWGTTEEKLSYFLYDLKRHGWREETGKKFRFHHKIFGKLPLGVNRLAGEIVYPHLD